MTVNLSAPLIYGYGVVGRALAEALTSRGYSNVVVVDDRAHEINAEMKSGGVPAGIELVAPDDGPGLMARVAAASVVLPSPGLGDNHRVLDMAAESGTPVRSEFDLAQMWDERPLVVITGTNGKTTVTEMVTHILNGCGRRAAAVGNTDVPLVAAIADPGIEVFVVEASSFRLAHTDRIEPTVAVWLNLAPDHLDAHRSLETYVAAKASLFAHLGPNPAVVNADDPTVMANLPAEVNAITFGHDSPWSVRDGALWGPGGKIIDGARFVRNRAHDLSNALAAVATVAQLGVPPTEAAEQLTTFVGLPHRLEPVATFGGVTWYNDSKATVPHATLAALDGFESVVLIAGGRNKGVDLSSLADGVPPVRSVVAMGEAGPEVATVFDGAVDVRIVDSLHDAVRAASEIANQGDAVILSPGCTSFDQFSNYAERGRAFVAEVRQLAEASTQETRA